MLAQIHQLPLSPALQRQLRPRPGYVRRVIDPRLLPLEAATGQFRRPSFLELALTYKGAGLGVDNDRLEFLGDRIIAQAVAEWMYRAYDHLDSHEMTRLYGWVTSREVQAKRARALRLGTFANLGTSLKQVVEKDGYDGLPVTVLSNLYEAVVGAIYLDRGQLPSRKFVVNDLIPELHGHVDVNYKSQLQELLQAQGKHPGWRTVGREGTDDKPLWTVKVISLPGGETIGVGRGKNIGEAQQAASHMALQKLKVPVTPAVSAA